jgi:hypothetical protein
MKPNTAAMMARKRKATAQVSIFASCRDEASAVPGIYGGNERGPERN